MAQSNTYNPEIPLESLTRAIKEYADNAFSAAVEVIMEFPSTDTVLKLMPLEKTIVHFEIDAMEDRLLGFGDNIVDYNLGIFGGGEIVQPQEGRVHRINFDVGIWSSNRSGGTTSRLRIKQTLDLLFLGSIAQKNLSAAVDVGEGTIEILQYSGGRFVTDSINDIDVYRMVDSSLDVRIFSRTPIPAPQTAVSDIVNVANHDVDGAPIT